MRNLTRQPIHLHIAQRGKICKNSREVVQQHQPQIEALVISAHLQPRQIKNASPRMKQMYFFKKHDSTEKQRKNNQQKVLQVQSGSFRAIHTACHFDSLKGFPLRSYIPIKPFRRGIRSSSVSSNKPLQLGDLQTQRPRTKYMRASYHSSQLTPFNINNVAIFHTPEYVPKYKDIQNFEQFYVYKGSAIQQNLKLAEQNRKIAGTKIQPFKKYKIREIMRKTSPQKRSINQTIEIIRK